MPPSVAPAPPRSRRLLAYALLVTAIASWGVNWAVARAVTGEVPTFSLVFFRWFFAGLLLLPFAARHAVRDLAVARANWQWLMFFGVTGAAAFPMLGYLGLRHTTAINASLLNTAMPLFMIPIAWLIRGYTVRPLQLAGLPLSLAGAVAIVSSGNLQVLAELRLNPGDLLILGAVALWALYTVLLDRRPKMHPLSFILYSTAAAIVFSLPFYLADLVAGAWTPVNARTVAAIGYLAVFPSIVAYVCWNQAVATVGPNVASFFNPLTPVFGTLAAVVLLGEELHTHHVAGFVLVLAGLLLTTRR